MQMNSVIRLAIVTCALSLAPAFAFDGTTTPPDAKPPVTPGEAFRSGATALKAGQNDKALSSLQYAAEQGYAIAQWKLGRMYAAGEGVPRDELRAFQYFSRIANTHAEDSPQLPQARFVANAFVQLGHYYLHGYCRYRSEGRSRPRARNVCLCGVVFRRSRCAIQPRQAAARRRRRREGSAPGVCAGSASPPTRGSRARRPCSAA